MPRDLHALAEEQSQTPERYITQSPDAIPDQDFIRPDDDNKETGLEAELRLKEEQSLPARDRLHPYVQTLSISDLPSCQTVEHDAFPPQERCTTEKFQYRLTKCPELCLGIFTSIDELASEIPTAATALPVSLTSTPPRKSVLLGHILATRTTNPTITDDDMAIPDAARGDSDSIANPALDPSSGKIVGHREDGRTICIHSLAVLTQYHGHGLGSTLMKEYIQRMESQNLADRIAIIVHGRLVQFYEKFGFVDQGESAVEFAGGGWRDMVRELKRQ